MKPETLEHALHLWPDWYKSIENARKTLRYTPGYPLNQLKEWRRKNNSEIWTLAEEVIRGLKLPLCLKFYWLCCFYANYQNPDGTFNFAAIFNILTSAEGTGDKMYPWLEPNVWYPPEAYQEELSIPSAYQRAMPFRIEGDIQLLDWDSLMEGVRQVSILKKSLLNRDTHPLTPFVMKAKELVKPQDRERKNKAIERYRNGLVSLQDLVNEELKSSEVQSQLSSYKIGHSGNEYILFEERKRKQIYNKWRNRLLRINLL